MKISLAKLIRAIVAQNDAEDARAGRARSVLAKAAPEGALQRFIPLTKIDEEKREAWGVAAEEAPDQSGEVMDYAASKAHFERWSESIHKASGGKSLGNLRAMHSNVAAGKLIHLDLRDAEKVVYVGAKIVDDAEWRKVREGVYTGFSIGGNYGKTWRDPDNPELLRYEAIPVEVSLADNPCMSGATFEVVKAGGVSAERAFKVQADEKDEEAGEEVIKEETPAPQKPAPEKSAPEPAPEEPPPAAEAQPAAADDAEDAPQDEERADPPLNRNQVLDLLADLGLVEIADGNVVASSFARAAEVRQLRKGLISPDELAKARADIKTLTGDLVKVAQAVEENNGELERVAKLAAQGGPVLRDLGAVMDVVRDVDASHAEDEQVLKTLLREVSDPQARQIIGQKLADLQIRGVHARPGVHVDNHR